MQGITSVLWRVFNTVGDTISTVEVALGGGVSESMDGRGCAILALELEPQNLIFT